MGSKKKAVIKTYTVSFSTLAKRRKYQIEDHISLIQDQPLNAVKVGDAFNKVFDRIASNPFLFKPCEELPSPDNIFRKATCLSWYVIYQIIESEVVILDIIHHSQNPSKLNRLDE
jgi:plasmid stabilization system protein ParE